jgi:hypothetical protein
LANIDIVFEEGDFQHCENISFVLLVFPYLLANYVVFGLQLRYSMRFLLNFSFLLRYIFPKHLVLLLNQFYLLHNFLELHTLFAGTFDFLDLLHQDGLVLAVLLENSLHHLVFNAAVDGHIQD